MNKKGFKIFTFLLFPVVFVLIFFSFINQTEAACRDYCCGGQDGLGAPDGGNKDEVCGGATWDYYAGACGRVDCVDTRSEKGYCYPWPQQTDQRCCGPYYTICDGPVCGNGVKEDGEDCDPSGSICTDGGQGICTSTCKCCVQCTLQCPVPLNDYAPTAVPHPLSEYTYEDIATCQDGANCSEPRDHSMDCYEVPSPQPTASLIIHPENVSTYLGFNSNTHTGGGLYETVALGVKDNTVNDFYPYSSERYPDSNNLFYMEATFTDVDNPIESTYVWFNKSGIKPITPMYIDLNNDTTPLRYGTQNKEEFGFLLHHNLGVWTPYIPAISGDGDNTGDLWKQASNGYSEQIDEKTVISIPGPTGIIAKVLIESVTYSDNGKKVIIRFSISFKDSNTSLLSNRPNEGNYKIWLMGNDTFGFTPYDNYEDKEDIVKTAIHNRWITNERIRYYDQWNNTSQSWNLNFDVPSIEKFSLTPSESSSAQVIMDWGFAPDPELPDEFSNIVINLYKSEGLNIDPILISVNDNGGATAVDVNNNFVPEENGNSNDIVGSLIETSNHYLLKITGGSGDGSATLTLNNVGQGLLYFTMTVFDKGGNVTSNSNYPLDLRDWLITQGGLLYSNSIDINVDHGDMPDGWDTKNLLSNILHNNADISTEMIGIRSNALPTTPSKSEYTNSFMIRPFNIEDPNSGYYTSLLERFNRKRRFIQGLENLGNIGSISGSLSSYGEDGILETEIAVVEREGNFTVSDTFNCNRQGVFFVNGNLTINGKITNGNVNKDACIFVVSGEVAIGEGTDFAGTQLEYDQVNAYILSDGKIVIENDVTDFNGLYISGGIHSLSNPGVVFQRSLKVADRLRFPALVVNHHSKYGMLAGRLFGHEITVQSTEVGLKPY